MSPIETLPPPAASPARLVGLIALRAYLLLAVAILSVKIAELIQGDTPTRHQAAGRFGSTRRDRDFCNSGRRVNTPAIGIVPHNA